MLLCRLRVSMLASASSLMCRAFFFGIFGSAGSTILGARDEASETGVRSRKLVDVGGTGKVISASLDAVLRRRWEDSDFAPTEGIRMIP